METILIILAILIAIGWVFGASKARQPRHRGGHRRNRCRCGRK